MLLCNPSHITDLLLEAYVTACEGQNPGITERTIEAVSGEITCALSYRYPQPWPRVPEVVRSIAAVISAYRIVSAITSLVSTESATENEWIPLQKQWKYCTEQLEDIISGKLKLDLPEACQDREEASVAVRSEKPFFSWRGF